MCFGTWRSQASRPVLAFEVCFFLFCILGLPSITPQSFRKKKKLMILYRMCRILWRYVASFCLWRCFFQGRFTPSLRLPDVYWGALFPVRRFLKRCSVLFFVFAGTHRRRVFFSPSKFCSASLSCASNKTNRRCILFWFLVYIRMIIYERFPSYSWLLFLFFRLVCDMALSTGCWQTVSECVISPKKSIMLFSVKKQLYTPCKARLLPSILFCYVNDMCGVFLPGGGGRDSSSGRRCAMGKEVEQEAE